MPRKNVLHWRPSRFSIIQFPQAVHRPEATSLSPAVRSLYRIFLRATSASVVHHSTGTRCLRTRFRPVFEQYARLHQTRPTTPEIAKQIREWDERIDNTLSFLQNSATTSGLPHKLTRNLSLLVNSRYLEQKHTSHPKYDPNRNVKKPAPVSPTTELSEQLHRMLEETTTLAEGMGRIVLGSTQTKY